ncbi:Cytochrome bd-type quinol oxidase, subunit 2 [Promicromonospora umidemergens]|uniref:Cytochrome bd-type quinol oxidase subunit 2 n=1 Tax=Promicromonospora umidemergens TaxID=629679 RepID=A0ABP8X6Z9_9MICO|nr:cytochrome d ubiquinol oxidase subunit II [Promicromonospora umidemergens]MCP2281357.1 Cytochrome bd-type quinol oxidase, subunit 2 [Promicromonospora umidemergens]
MNAAAWSVLLTVLVAGWVLLDGAIQGAGATLLQERDHDGGDRRREPAERRVVLGAVWPLLLPGEVWLVAAVAVLVGVFPQAGAELLDAGYPVVIMLVGSWVLRDAGIWLRSRRPGRVWRDVWDVALVVASIVLAGSWGALLGIAWGSGLAALVLGIVAVVVTRLHGDAVVAWRLRRTGPLPVVVTSVMITAPVVGTAVSAWPHLVEGGVSAQAMASLGLVALVVLPVVLALQGLAWWLVSRPLGGRDTQVF